MILALKVEERAMSQEMQVAPRSWKEQGSRFFPKSSRRIAVLTTSSFQLIETDFKLWTSRTVRQLILCCVKPRSFCDFSWHKWDPKTPLFINVCVKKLPLWEGFDMYL